MKVNRVEGRDFPVELGVHQGSVLSSLLFVIVIEALSRRFDDRGLPWQFLYADDLVLLADSEDDLKRKLKRWQNGLEAKGLRVNVGKTKVMKCGVGLQKVVDSGKYPCRVCGKDVEDNSIQCTLCIKTVHKRCSGISRKLRAKDAEAFKCKTCVKRAQGSNKSEMGCVELDDDQNLKLLKNSAILVICYMQEGEQRKLLELEYGQLGESLMS